MTASSAGAENPMTTWTTYGESSQSRRGHQNLETSPPLQPLVSTPTTTTSPFPSIPSDSSPSPSPSPSPSDLSSPSIPQSLVRRNMLSQSEFLQRPITPLNLGSLPSFPFPDSSRGRGRRDEEGDGLEEVRQDGDEENNRGREEGAPFVDEADLDTINPTTTPSSPLPLRYWPRFPPSPLSPDILLSPLRRPRTAFPFPSPELGHRHIRPQTSQHLTKTPPPAPSRALSSPSGSTYLSPWRARPNHSFFSGTATTTSHANGASRALWLASAAKSSSSTSPSALSRSWSDLDARGESDAWTSSHLELGSPLAVRDWTGRSSQDEVD